MALPEVGLQAVLEGVDEFERGAKTIADAMRMIAQESQTLAKESSQAAEQTGSAFEQMAQLMALGGLQQVAGTAGQVGNQLLGMAKAATMTAARAEELDAVLVNLAERNNLAAAAMRNQVAAIKEQGITTAVASNLVSQFVRSNLDLEKASQLARIAQDAAVISMEDSSQALSGLLHGILTLQPEILRYRGIIVDLQGEYTRWAQANGRAVQSLTGAEKQMIALDAVIAQGTSIAGTYEAAMDTAAKQMRSFDRYVQELQEDFGQALLPVFTKAVFTAKDLTKALMALPEPLKASVALTGALAGGLLKGTSAMVGFGAQVGQLAVAMNTLGFAAKGTALAILGPAGLVAALMAIAAIGIVTYINEQERAHRAEAAAALDSAESYRDYLEKLDEAGLGTYAMTESLYDLVQALEDTSSAIDSIELQNAQQDLQELVNSILEANQHVPTFTAETITAAQAAEASALQMQALVKEASDLDLIILKDAESVRRMGEAFGLANDDLEQFVEIMTRAAGEEEIHRAAVQASTGREEDYWKRIIETNEGLDERARNLASMEKYGEMANDMMDIAAARERAYAAEVARTTQQIQAKQMLMAMSAQLSAQAAEKILDAEQRADEQREDARARLMDSLIDLEKDHAKRVAGILEDLADTDADLQAELAKADLDYQKNRLALEQQYAEEIAQAEQDLADKQAELRRDLNRDLADLDRKYAQQRADEARDLARDLEEIERDHLASVAELTADYKAQAAELIQDYNDQIYQAEAEHRERMAALEQKYSQQQTSIVDKYLAEILKKRYGHMNLNLRQQEYYMEQLRQAYERGENIGLGSQEDNLNFELEMLAQAKAEEQAALEAAQAERLAQLEAALGEEQAAQQAAYETALAEELAAYQERKAERDRQHQERMADLEAALGREREERQRRYQEQMADLQAEHQAELAEIQRANAERAAQLEQRLAEEKTKLEEANQENKARLAEQLADEQANYAERQSELQGAYAKQNQTIDDELAKKTRAIQEDLAGELVLWLDHWKNVDQGTYEALKGMVENNLGYWFGEGLRKAQQFRTDIENILGPFNSPSKWMSDMGKGMELGLEKNLDLGTLLGGYTKAFSSFRNSTDRVAQVAPAMYGGPSQSQVTNQRTYQLNYTGAEQGETGIRSLFTMMEMASA